MEQVELFQKLGADINHIVLSHVDRRKDLSFHRDLMQTGVYVEYDSHFRWKDKEDNWLPSPKGPFYLILRNYAPDPELGKALVNIDAFVGPPGVFPAN